MEFWSLVVQTVVSNAVAQLWSSNVYGRPKAKEWKNLCPTCYEWFVQVIFLKLTHWAMQRSSTPFPFTIQSKSKYLPSLMRISKYPVMNCNISFLDISTKTPTLKLPHAPSSPTHPHTDTELHMFRGPLLQIATAIIGSRVYGWPSYQVISDSVTYRPVLPWLRALNWFNY